MATADLALQVLLLAGLYADSVKQARPDPSRPIESFPVVVTGGCALNGELIRHMRLEQGIQVYRPAGVAYETMM